MSRKKQCPVHTSLSSEMGLAMLNCIVLFIKSDLPGGRDCLSLSAFSLSVTTNVCRYLEHRTLNFTLSLVLTILTAKVIKIQCVHRHTHNIQVQSITINSSQILPYSGMDTYYIVHDYIHSLLGIHYTSLSIHKGMASTQTLRHVDYEVCCGRHVNKLTHLLKRSGCITNQ